MSRSERARGFTLIELIAVIVILGILAAAAVPRFVDLSQAARESAVQGVAGALGSASAINFAHTLLISQGYEGLTAPVFITDCDEAPLLLDGGLPDGYEVQATAVSHLVSITCVLVDQRDTSVTAEFLVHGVNPAEI